MVETALILLLVVFVVMLVNVGMMLLFDDAYMGIGFFVHIICGIGYVAGLFMLVWGLLEHFKVID